MSDLAEFLAETGQLNDLTADKIIPLLGKLRSLDAILMAKLVCTTVADAREKLGTSASEEISQGETLTIQEVAQILNRSEKYVRELARAGKMAGQKNGNRWEFTHEAVREYQNQHRKKALDQAVSHSYNPTRERATTKNNPRTDGEDPKGTGEAGGRPLEHHRPVRKGRVRNSRAVVPFSYDHLKGKDTDKEKVESR